MQFDRLKGVFAAAVTPLHADLSPDLAAMPSLLAFLAEQGSHGALLSGTTGEGPAFSGAERAAIWQAAAEVREDHPDFVLMAGTGTPSLSQTIELNKAAFDAGFDVVVTLPPFYFRNAGDEGLFDWFAQVIEESVPEGRWMLGYHIPQVAGIGLSIPLLLKLREAFPTKFAGIKDSTGKLPHAKEVLDAVDDEFIMLVGNDKLVADGLAAGGAGCITAMANLHVARARAVWDAFQAGGDTSIPQKELTAARKIFDQYPPFPASAKALLRTLYGFDDWPVRPPLLNLDPTQVIEASKAMHNLFDPR